MRAVFERLQSGKIELGEHSFFEWLNESDVEADHRFVFAPVLVDFIMGFADMNKWFLTYPNAQNALEEIINEHAAEDATHSRLFYDNWYTLALGGAERWSPGRTLWWIFHARETESVRRFAMKILDVAARETDPLIRFALIEAIEVCGDVFFGHTAPVATAIVRGSGRRHDYFGQYHRERENGHLQADESPFARAKLDETQRARALHAVELVLACFTKVLDDLLHYARRAEADTTTLMASVEMAYQTALPRGGRCTPTSVPSLPDHVEGHARLADLLRTRLARLHRHPFMQWLEEEHGVAPREKLQRFVALWGVDIVAYRDFNELVMRYSVPSSPDEHALNGWTEELSSHALLYLRDWENLGMDDALDWDAGETIAFYFLSPQTEWHRESMAAIKKCAFRDARPVARWWLLKALEASGEPLFERTRSLAEAVEAAEGIRLDYWAGRHAVEGAEPGRAAVEGRLSCLRQPLSDHDVEGLVDTLKTVFDNMEMLYSRALEEASSAAFVRAPGTLPPPRVSEIVLKARASDADVTDRTG